MAGSPVEGAVVFVLDDIKAPDGIWLSIDAMPLTDEGGILHNGVAILHNITAQKKVEEALLRAKDAAVAASLAKSQFLANMSHELRTPLNAIIGYSEMLQEAAEDEGHDASVPDLQRIHAAGKHLLTLIDDILDLSKIEAGKMELFLEPFDVTALVQDVAATVQPLVEKNGNVMAVRCGDDLGDMHADLTRVRQVLFNLLSNAGKFTREGARGGGCDTRVGERRRLDSLPGPGHRHRHDVGAGEPLVRRLHAGRRLDHAQVRRHRPWPGDQPALQPDDGRRHHRDQRGRRRLDVHAADSGESHAARGPGGDRVARPAVSCRGRGRRGSPRWPGRDGARHRRRSGRARPDVAGC